MGRSAGVHGEVVACGLWPGTCLVQHSRMLTWHLPLLALCLPTGPRRQAGPGGVGCGARGGDGAAAAAGLLAGAGHSGQGGGWRSLWLFSSAGSVDVLDSPGSRAALQGSQQAQPLPPIPCPLFFLSPTAPPCAPGAGQEAGRLLQEEGGGTAGGGAVPGRGGDERLGGRAAGGRHVGVGWVVGREVGRCRWGPRRGGRCLGP